MTIAEYNGIDCIKVTVDSTWADLEMDSLDLVQCAIQLENVFDNGITVGNEVLYQSKNVGDVVNHIRSERQRLGLK